MNRQISQREIRSLNPKIMTLLHEIKTLENDIYILEREKHELNKLTKLPIELRREVDIYLPKLGPLQRTLINKELRLLNYQKRKQILERQLERDRFY